MQLNSADIFIPTPSQNYSKESHSGIKKAQDELANAAELYKSTSTSSSKSNDSTNAYEAKQLQKDTVNLSEEGQKKSAEESNHKDFRTTKTSTEPVNDTEEQAKALREAIAKLIMEIMEISRKITQLRTKDDEKSIKERQSLENELALKKGMLDAKVTEQLELAK